MFSIEGFFKYAPSLNFVVKLVMFIFTNIINAIFGGKYARGLFEFSEKSC